MKKRITLAFLGASAIHAIAILGFPSSKENGTEDPNEAFIDLVLEEPTPSPELEPEEPGEQDPDEEFLPDEFLAPGLSEPLPTSLAVEAITQLVKPERLRLPRPDGMQTIGIPTGAQRKRSGGQIAGNIFSLAELDRPPSTRYEYMPKYPHELKTSGTKGTAILMMIVDRQGRVIKVDIETATHQQFGRAAQIAGLKWHFEPGLKDGKPVSFRVRVPFHFNP